MRARITSRKSPVGLVVRGPELQLRRLQHRAQRQDPGRESFGVLLLSVASVAIIGLAPGRARRPGPWPVPPAVQVQEERDTIARFQPSSLPGVLHPSCTVGQSVISLSCILPWLKDSGLHEMYQITSCSFITNLMPQTHALRGIYPGLAASVREPRSSPQGVLTYRGSVLPRSTRVRLWTGQK